MSTRDEDATQSEVLIWSYEALDVDSSGYAMRSPKDNWLSYSTAMERSGMATLPGLPREAPTHCDVIER